MDARMDKSMEEDVSDDGEHGATSPPSHGGPPEAPSSSRSPRENGTVSTASPGRAPLDVGKLAAVIDEIEADMVDDDDDDPEEEDVPSDDERFDRDSARTRSPRDERDEDEDEEDEDDDEEDEQVDDDDEDEPRAASSTTRIHHALVPAHPAHVNLHGEDDPAAHAQVLARWQLDDVDAYESAGDAGFDVLDVDRDEEDSFIASELVHTGAGTYGAGEEDGKEGDVHDVQGRRVGWWQPKVGEEREATDARVWREDLGMVPNEEDDPGGNGDDLEDEATVPNGPRDSAQDFAKDSGGGDDDASDGASDASSTGWITDEKTKDRRDDKERRRAPPPPKTHAPAGVFDAVSGWNADFAVVDVVVHAVTNGDGSAAHVVTTSNANAGNSFDVNEANKTPPLADFAFDKSPSLSVNGGGRAGSDRGGLAGDGTATPASECADGPALGWGGSEFGGSATPRSDKVDGEEGEGEEKGKAAAAARAAGGAALNGAADALRAWADSNADRTAPPEPGLDFESEAEERVEVRRRESLDASWADGNLSDEREDDFACDRLAYVGDDEVKDEDEEEDDPDETFVTFNLPIVHRLHRTGFEEEKDFPVRIGDVVAGRYELTEYLGSAAFSKAVQAVDLDTADVVCLKIVKNNKDYFDQSLDEIKLLRYINDEDPDDAKGILRMYDYFYHREHLFIVTELLRANLYEFQRYNLESGEEPYFTLSALKKISRQLLTSLEYLHSLDLIHCDLKPENILIKSYSRCEVKVIDFGSSCYVTDHLSSYVQSRSYRAPEVILGAPYDTKVDMWSLGCILAELYTGEVLLHNDSLASLLARCVGIFGPFDPRLLRRGRYSANYFTKSGLVYERCEKTEMLRLMRPKKTTLARRLGFDPEVDEAECGSDGFVGFLLALLAVNPDERLTATQALTHPWLAEEELREEDEKDDEKREGAAAAEEGDAAADGETKADEGGGVSPDLMPTEANIEAEEEAAEPRMVEAQL